MTNVGGFFGVNLIGRPWGGRGGVGGLSPWDLDLIHTFFWWS
jgi:hypothetical protein